MSEHGDIFVVPIIFVCPDHFARIIWRGGHYGESQCTFWLQEIDNPFFNDIPGERLITKQIRGNQEAFAQGWTDQWGRYPDATPENMHMNYQVYLCSSATGRNQVISNDLSIAVSSEPAATPDEHVFNVLLGDISLAADNGVANAPSLPRRINLERILRKEINP